MVETVLHIDIDWKVPKKYLEFYKKTRCLLLEALGFKMKRMIVKPSPSKKGIHIWIYIEGRKLSEHDVNRFQWAVGNDDLTRTKINYLRIRRGMKRFWSKIFSHVVWRKPLPKNCQTCHLRQVLAEMEAEIPV